ncbi:MAG: PGPGW domain-containing protein [Bryobacterales bacterium]|nr:PGPGW domain-containing protein [Bryobacterales bacterium]
MSKLLEVSAGAGLVVLGIAGLILPVMPGWVFLIPGLMILSRHFRWAKGMLEWAKKTSKEARSRFDDLSGRDHKQSKQGK